MFTLYENNEEKWSIGVVFCPTCENEKCVYFSTINAIDSNTLKRGKKVVTCLKFHRRNKRQH